MRITGFGQILFAAGMIGLGIVGLIFDDFAMSWQPVPADLPGHQLLAYISALLLLCAGIGLFMHRVAALSALVLAAFIFLWLLLLQFPRLIPDPLSVGVWLGVGETLELMTGVWVLGALLATKNSNATVKAMTGTRTLRIAILLFAVSLPLIGLSHFVYAKETASMVPAWLPSRITWAYLTGLGHILAGAALLFGIYSRLAATLEAMMMTSFVLLVHIPGVVADPHSRLQWTMLCVAMAISGGAWAVTRATSVALINKK